MVPEQIEREVVITAPIERVWATITQPEHVGTWFGDAGAEIDLRPGGAILIHWADYGTGYGIVERVEPPRVFAFRGALHDRRLLAWQNLVLVFDLADIEAIAQQME